ncbi:MAG: SOS response-associated peptidase [Rhodoglobus sp.]
MCGRFVVAGASSDLVALFDVDLVGENLPGPSWNIAPTDPVAIVLDALPKGDDGDAEPVRRLEAARWGLIPSWAKEPRVGVTAFNARIETASEKPHFKAAVERRRALIPANGYYEWHTVDGEKTPYFVTLPDSELMMFAGLYEWWRDPEKPADSAERWVLSTTILTRDSSGELAGIHDRMPVFLAPELVESWLDPHEEGSLELLEATSEGAIEQAERMEFYPVGREVGNVRNNGPELAQPLS